MSAGEPGRTGRGGTGRKVVLLLALLVGLIVLGRFLGGRLPEIDGWIAQRGAGGMAVFGLIYVIATVAFVPGSVLTLAAGALFGVARGVAIVFPAAVVGSTLAFLISRYLARPLMERRVRADGRFAFIDSAVAREGLGIVFLLRLSPLMPFNLLNYALGLTKVRLRDYLLASLGMLPGTLLYVYSGRVAGDLVAIGSGAATERGTAHQVLLVAGLIATAVVTFRLATIARGALRRAAGGDAVAGG